MDSENIIKYYIKTHNFIKTADKFNINKRILHLLLAKAGVLKINDKIDFGSTNIRRGGLAEQKFAKIFPEAISTNDYWQRNYPRYDFDLKGLTIDVKYSSCRCSSKSNFYSWQCHGNKNKENSPVDFFVIFLEREPKKELDKPYIVAIPGGMVKGTIYISKKGPIFQDFQMANEVELREYLLTYANILQSK